MGQVSQAIEMCYKDMGISQYGFIRTKELQQLKDEQENTQAHSKAKEKMKDFDSIFVFTTEQQIAGEEDLEQAYAAYRKARQQTIRFFKQFFREQVLVLSCKSADNTIHVSSKTRRLTYQTFEECQVDKDKLAEIAGVTVENTEHKVTCIGCLFF